MIQNMEPLALCCVGLAAIVFLIVLIKCCGRQQGQSYTFQNESSRKFGTYSPFIDLHGCWVSQARDKLVAFLRQCSNSYSMNGRRECDRSVYVVTGRGLHSKGGYPAIKEDIQVYLNTNGYRFWWNNDGEAVIRG